MRKLQQPTKHAKNKYHYVIALDKGVNFEGSLSGFRKLPQLKEKENGKASLPAQ